MIRVEVGLGGGYEVDGDDTDVWWRFVMYGYKGTSSVGVMKLGEDEGVVGDISLRIAGVWPYYDQ